MSQIIDKKSKIYDAVGDLDEVQALIDLCITYSDNYLNKRVLQNVRDNISSIMSILTGYMLKEDFNKERLNTLMDYVKMYQQACEEQNFTFLKFSDSKYIAHLNFLRTVIRRSERNVLKVLEYDVVNEYLNKLSTLVFYMSKIAKEENGK